MVNRAVLHVQIEPTLEDNFTLDKVGNANVT